MLIILKIIAKQNTHNYKGMHEMHAEKAEISANFNISCNIAKTVNLRTFLQVIIKIDTS